MSMPGRISNLAGRRHERSKSPNPHSDMTRLTKFVPDGPCAGDDCGCRADVPGSVLCRRLVWDYGPGSRRTADGLGAVDIRTEELSCDRRSDGGGIDDIRPIPVSSTSDLQRRDLRCLGGNHPTLVFHKPCAGGSSDLRVGTTNHLGGAACF